VNAPTGPQAQEAALTDLLWLSEKATQGDWKMWANELRADTVGDSNLEHTELVATFPMKADEGGGSHVRDLYFVQALVAWFRANASTLATPARVVSDECSHCDGVGGFRRAICCGKGNPLGDCCGNPDEEMEPCPQCGGSGEQPRLSVTEEVSRIEDAIASGEMGAHMAFTKMRQLIAALSTIQSGAEGKDGWLPIESAPEGEFLALVQGRAFAAFRVGNVIKAEYCNSPFITQPTHWHPYPTPPNTALQPGQESG
jgi:hypothetical protein